MEKLAIETKTCVSPVNLGVVICGSEYEACHRKNCSYWFFSQWQAQEVQGAGSLAAYNVCDVE